MFIGLYANYEPKSPFATNFFIKILVAPFGKLLVQAAAFRLFSGSMEIARAVPFSSVPNAYEREESDQQMSSMVPADKGKKIKKSTYLRRTFPLYLMMVPGLAYLVINNYLPMFGLSFAFKDINYTVGIWQSPWVGFDNFSYLFRTNDAFVIFRNTVLYNLAFIVLGTVLAIVVAILLSQIKGKMMRVYQTSILIPYLLSITVVSYLAFAFLSVDSGFINNSILAPLGIDPIGWYSSPGYWPYILIFIYLWKNFGYNTILYYATLIGIDDSYYEAAVIDGANTWQQIRHITLPCLKTTIITLVIMAIGRMFYSDFGLFYQVPMNNGLLYSATNTIDTYVFRGLLQLNDVGRSSAAGFLQSVLGFVLVLGANFIVKKVDAESALF